ncbi:adenylate/guanylate cyclase domain-containing protein [Gleimia europaea]|nr:adenylate/guanylate cyclase domain-containing protein [Gleimia europaea]MDK8533099.1 adenylate/guanylate cyclase domain-containing protein [Gleimia europaea]
MHNTSDAGHSPSTTGSYRKILLGGEPTLSAADVAARTETPVTRVNSYWVAMGFAPAVEGEVVFTTQDLKAYQRWSDLIDSGRIDLQTGLSLVRAQAHITDRLVLWQMEALVDDVARRYTLDDTSARLVTLDKFREFLPFLEEELIYSWKRQLESIITRVDQEVSHRGRERETNSFPLIRTLGFVDMVSYTSSSVSLPEEDLVDLIDQFETVCRIVIPSAGGRVVKMIGDAVFYIADDLPTGLRVVTELMQRLNSMHKMLPVRASIVQGAVFSRSGDVFGPPVNLASRLVDVAPVGQIITDGETAGKIARGEAGPWYRVSAAKEADLRGVGRVVPFQVRVEDRPPVEHLPIESL